MSQHRTGPHSSQANQSCDVACLLAEIEELRRIADRLGQGTLAFFLECSAIEARAQARSQTDEQASQASRPD
jgi:hypothetical protein